MFHNQATAKSAGFDLAIEGAIQANQKRNPTAPFSAAGAAGCNVMAFFNCFKRKSPIATPGAAPKI